MTPDRLRLTDQHIFMYTGRRSGLGEYLIESEAIAMGEESRGGAGRSAGREVGG